MGANGGVSGSRRLQTWRISQCARRARAAGLRMCVTVARSSFRRSTGARGSSGVGWRVWRSVTWRRSSVGVVQRSGVCCAAARAGYESGRAGVVVCPSVRRYLYVCAYACAVVSLARRSRGVRPGLARVAVEWCVSLRWDVHDTPPVPCVGDCGNTVVSVRTVPTPCVVHYPQFPSCM